MGVEAPRLRWDYWASSALGGGEKAVPLAARAAALALFLAGIRPVPLVDAPKPVQQGALLRGQVQDDCLPQAYVDRYWPVAEVAVEVFA